MITCTIKIAFVMISDHFDDLYYIEKNPRPHYMSLDSIRISTCLKKKKNMQHSNGLVGWGSWGTFI